MLKDLREAVCEANIEISRLKLAPFTWGNASGIDRDSGLVAIKPSGVAYDRLTPEHIVLVDLKGKVVKSSLKPSSDTATHIVLYREFESIGGVAHTHSPNATAFAQACRPLPCLGTTHADHFHGEVPVTAPLTDEQVSGDYEAETGRSVVEAFKGLEPDAMPGVLCANHGPFTWGKDAAQAVYHAAVLEECARMALATYSLAPATPALRRALLDKHYLRKHGPDATYGQR